MRRTVQLIDSKNAATIRCKLLRELPTDGDVIDEMPVSDIQQIYVGVDDGDIRFKKPWEYQEYCGYTFYKARPKGIEDCSCNFLYFCVKLSYLIIWRSPNFAPEMITDSDRILSAEELREQYSGWLTCEEDVIQVLDGSDNVVSEYRAGN